MIEAIRKLVRFFGIEFYRPNPFHLITDYPVSDRPRYGYKTSVHPEIYAMLNERRGDFLEVLQGIATMETLIATIPLNEHEGDPLLPYWNNGWLPPRDGAAIMHFLQKLKPRRFLEIGSGYSTKFARLAIGNGALNTTITSIDPQPRAEIDMLCDRVVRSALEDVDLTVFDELEAGDILSFDGSHRAFMDSDVTVFFLEVLPRLRAGVIVQIHDIFWPKDYPRTWGHRYYSEQYMLGVLLIAASTKIMPLLSNAFIDQDPELGDIAKTVMPNNIDDLHRFGEGVWPNAFWFELKEPL